MCKPASFVVTKNKVFWSKHTESHHEIISEFGLKEKNVRGDYRLICVEIVPPNSDYRLPFSKWKYSVDTGGYGRELPTWYDAAKVEAHCRSYLKEWRKAKVVMPNESRVISSGQVMAVYGTVEHIHGGTVKYIHGGTVKYINGGTVEYLYGGTVKYMYGGAVKYIYGGTVEYIHGGAVECIDGGVVEHIDGGTVKRMYGGTVEHINGGTVKYSSGTLPPTITGCATIIAYSSLSPDILKSAHAVLIDRSKTPVVCHVGKDE